MVKVFRKFTLQRKILFTVLSLSIFTIFIIILLITYKDYKETFNNKGNLSLQTSKSLSFMDQTKKSLQYETDNMSLHSLLTNINDQVDASFIYIVDKEGKVIGHTNNRFREHVKEIIPEYQAIVFGGSYTMIDEVFEERAVLGISPVFINEESVIGAVVVGYLVNDIYSELVNRIMSVLKIALIPLIFGIIISFALARNIRKDTYGMDPAEIALLYRDRNTILTSMSEGLIAIDQNNRITLMNRVARQILGVGKEYLGKEFKNLHNIVNDEIVFLPNENVIRYESVINNIPVIIRTVPLKDNNGFIVTIIDKSELKEVINALTEVKRYSEDLRSQTHEFSNKLYVILGLIQLGEYEKVETMILDEVSINEYSNRIIFEQINDPNVQAILLGKISKASENKVEFNIDENSSLDALPPFINTSSLTIIIGNLIDNAIEAVKTTKNKKVTFFGIDYGSDIIFEVTDEGVGIEETNIDKLFEKGYSTKSLGNRGFGLLNVKNALLQLGGTIEINSNETETTFTIYIPKINGREKY